MDTSKPPYIVQNKEIPLRYIGSQSGSDQYHTLKYDFKPASLSNDEPAQLELTCNGQVSIEAPNVEGSTALFRGQRRPHVKECLLIIDHQTGEVVLQKLCDNITVKATRTSGTTSTAASLKANSEKQADGPQLSEESNSSSSSSSSSSSDSDNGFRF